MTLAAAIQKGNEEYARKRGAEPVEAPSLDGARAVAEVGSTVGFDVDVLLSEFKPEPTFDVFLPTGQKLVFKSFGSVAEKRAHDLAYARWYASLPTPGTPEANAHRYAASFPKSNQEAAYAYLIHSCSVDPKISIADALKLNQAPELVSDIMRQIDEGNKAPYLAARKTVIALLGKGSEEIEPNDL